ncbi:MAG: beta-lactamase family protein [Proteobacteria bacterium]|nr:beta-lactamase family protein [Pseudomonadota bacterium]
MSTPRPAPAPAGRAPLVGAEGAALLRARAPDAIDRLMEQAMAQRVFPAACLLVAVDGQPVIHRAYGRARLDSVFDLASLTKPLATTSALLQCVAMGHLSLDARLGRVLDGLQGTALEGVTLAQLLGHAAGLVDWLPLYQPLERLPARRARLRARELIAATPLRCAPGEATCYSDLGYMLLGWALEAAMGEPLDRLAERLVFAPLALSRTGFVALAGRRRAQRDAQPWRFVPTERCPRRGRLCGEVHDDNCHAMGGVAGHAGLFSTAHDVHQIVRQLSAAARGGASIFDGALVRHCFSTQLVPGSSWRLGWDTPSGVRSSTGRAFGAGSVGHLGFTGTSLWLEPARPWWAILLTNRVYYGREPNRLKPLRPRLHDALHRALKGWGYL